MQLEEEGNEWEGELSFYDWYSPFEISDTGSSALASSDEAAGEYSRYRTKHTLWPLEAQHAIPVDMTTFLKR